MLDYKDFALLNKVARHKNVGDIKLPNMTTAACVIALKKLVDAGLVKINRPDNNIGPWTYNTTYELTPKGLELMKRANRKVASTLTRRYR